MILVLLEVRPKVSKRANRHNKHSSRGIESCAGESPAAESRGAGDCGAGRCGVGYQGGGAGGESRAGKSRAAESRSASSECGAGYCGTGYRSSGAGYCGAGYRGSGAGVESRAGESGATESRSASSESRAAGGRGGTGSARSADWTVRPESRRHWCTRSSSTDARLAARWSAAGALTGSFSALASSSASAPIRRRRVDRQFVGARARSRPRPTSADVRSAERQR